MHVISHVMRRVPGLADRPNVLLACYLFQAALRLHLGKPGYISNLLLGWHRQDNGGAEAVYPECWWLHS